MVKRWLGFLTVWLSCLIFFLFYRQWPGCILFAAVTALPPLSLFLMAPAIRSAKTKFDIPRAVLRGQEATVNLSVEGKDYDPLWSAKLRMRHSFSGKTRKIKPNQKLPTAHCGNLRIEVGGVYIHDPLGLFRFRIIPGQQFDIAVRPEPVAPESIPELAGKSTTQWRPRPGGGFSESHDLRSYRPGDDLRQIHWKLTAKTGSLILREPMEPLHSRLLLRLELMGTADEIDRKLAQLLWLSKHLLSKGLPHHWQALTATGSEEFTVTDEESLYLSLDNLLRRQPATAGSVLDQPSNAAWWHYIGGDSHEES